MINDKEEALKFVKASFKLKGDVWVTSDKSVFTDESFALKHAYKYNLKIFKVNATK